MIKGARLGVTLGGIALLAAASSLWAQKAELGGTGLKLRTGAVALQRTDAVELDSHHVVIQLARPLSLRERRLLVDAGVVLDAYIPENAYLANTAKADLNKLRQMPFITGIGKWQADWKLAPALAEPKDFVTAKRKALARNGKQHLIVHAHRDVDGTALQQQLTALGVEIHEQTYGYHGMQLLIDVATDQVDALKTIEAIRYVEVAPEAAPRNTTTNWIAQSNIPDMTPIWDQGLHGENQLVNLIDWNMDEFHCSFRDFAPPGPMHRKIHAYFGLGQSELFGFHGTHAASVLAGDPTDETASPDLTGIAFASRLVFQDQAALITPTNLGERLLIAQSEGAFVHSNSWGSTFDTSYNAWAADIDAFSFANEDNLVIFAIINGNAFSSLLSPENAKNCLAVGASGDAGDQENPGSGASGPTDDGRQKPEIWAPGCQSRAANVGTDCDVIQRSCATSWAAPAVAGLATLTRQYFMDGFYPNGTANAADALTPTGALLKAVVVNSAVDMTGIEGYYGLREGYGRVLLDDALYFDGDARGLIVHDVRHADGLQTSNTAEFNFAVTSDIEPLKVTLCYHDAPALIGTDFAPVNNLDLVVISPSGLTYRGNNYVGLETQADGSPDALNNTEQVTRLVPEVGNWQIIVEGTAVNDGPQGFALAITGAVGEAETEPAFDLAVTVEPADQVVAVSELGAIRVTVTNLSDVASRAGTLRIDVSEGLQTLDGPLELCFSTPSSIECDIDGLAAGAAQTLRRSLRVTQPGVHSFTATFVTKTDDENPDNNSATGIIRTPVDFDLQWRGISGPTILSPNTPTDYSATISNNGPGESTPTSVVIELDNGLRVVSSMNCDITSEQALKCGVPALLAGGAHQLAFSIIADGESASALQLRGSLAQPPVDNDETNNASTLSVTVRATNDNTQQNPPDTDGDGVPDDSDICADGDDALDADGDGTPDACDACPDDANKTDPQLCGCGNPETDSDADGIPDCGDGCPNDPNKLDAGDCGCGVPDADANENGTSDCLESNAPPVPMEGDEPAPLEVRLEDLDPCFVRYLMQSFLGIPLCGPCISFACCGIYAGIATMRRRWRKRRRPTRWC